MIKKQPHMWTKDDVKTVAKLWNSATVKELCDKLNVEYQQLNYIAKEMRKAGFDLPKKHSKGYVNSLLKEVYNEMN